MKNIVLEKFRQGRPTVGTFTHLKSMTAVEALGLTGLDFVITDMEHCCVSIDEANRYMIASRAAGVEPFIRVPDTTRASVLRALDIGAAGVIVPCIETVEQVREIVSHAKFRTDGQPSGNRGYCPTRDGGWGFADSYSGGMKGYMEECNASALLIPQCETAGCLEKIEEIAAIDGVDGVMIGPFDLSIAMGIPGDFGNPEFAKAVDRILAACKKAGKIAMIFTGSGADSKKRIAQGFDSAIIGLDVLRLISSYKSEVEEALS